jgi:RNA polymerase sigma factor (sigma-70 family)
VEVSALKQSAVPALRGPSPLLRLQSDERLIALVRRGQHAAFETLVSRYQSRLLAFCRHMLASREDAEDVLQEVFAAAFNAMLADDRQINVRPWLYRIARNRSLNHLRRASAIGVDSMDIHYAEGGISTVDKVLRRESFRQLIGDVHKLPETQRTALLLREIDALSYDQIADAMETTVPAVKSLLVRARISLAEAAEARKLSCEEARLELGEVAEGLVSSTPAVRRHVRECERCRAFRKHLKDNNVALAALLPVGPLLLLKKLALTKLGSTAGAGGAHVAGAGGAGAAAGAGAGGAGATGGLITAGAGALATKAAAGLAVAAIVTAGTVEADHSERHARHHAAAVAAVVAPTIRSSEPIVTGSSPQPASIVHRVRPDAHPSHTTNTKTAATAIVPANGQTPTSAAPKAATPPKPSEPPPVTEVTTETTQLSGPSGDEVSSAAPPPATTPTSTAPSPPVTTPPPATTETPPPPPPVADPVEDPGPPASSSPESPSAGEEQVPAAGQEG